MSISRRTLFNIWREESVLKQKNLSVLAYVLNKLDLEETENEQYYKVKKVIDNYNSKVAKMWKDCQRTLKVFEARHNRWLDEDIVFFETTRSANRPENFSNGRKSRPLKDFSELSNQRKRQRVAPLFENYSQEELTFATRKSLQMSGRRDAATIVQEISDYSPTRATTIKKCFQTPRSIAIKYTADEALALYVDGRYTKRSYVLMQSGAKSRNAHIYPSYNSLLEAKKKCYPDEQHILVSDISAEVNLQAILNHTASRIVEMQKEVLNQKMTELSQGVTLVCKWGCDGSAGQSTYKQGYSEAGNPSK